LSVRGGVRGGVGRGVGGYLLDLDVELPLRITALLYTTALGLLVALFPRQVFTGRRRAEEDSGAVPA